MVDNAQTRNKEWLDTYIDPADITKDDGETPCNIHNQWADPPYNVTRLFFGKGHDVIFSVAIPKSVAITDHDGKTIGYNEKSPIYIQAVDKNGVTATQVLEKAQAALRKAVEDHWEGSYRSLNVASSPKTINVGGWTIYGLECNLTYERDVT